MTTITCPVDGTEARRYGACDIAPHFKTASGYERCGYEDVWRKDGDTFCGDCGAKLEWGTFGYYCECPETAKAR